MPIKGLNPIPSPVGRSTPDQMHEALTLSRFARRLEDEAEQEVRQSRKPYPAPLGEDAIGRIGVIYGQHS